MATVSAEDFISAWHENGCSPVAVAAALQCTERNVYMRRAHLQAQGVELPTISANPAYLRTKWTYPREICPRIEGGSVLIGSDLHVWPGEAPPIWHAFVAVAREIEPTAIILNGDIIDGTRISRHPRLRNQGAPRVKHEIEAAQKWLGMLPACSGRFWTLGNHDQRVDGYLANQAPEMDDFAGDLKDRFSDWTFSYSVVINDSVEVRHNFRAGIHAGYNNAMHSGRTMVTGHTHQLECKAIVDRNGTRYGIECGMLNDPHAPVFEYTQGSPTRWRAGFIVLTFDKRGGLLPPEIAEWRDGACWFRGKAISKPRYRVKALSAAA